MLLKFEDRVNLEKIEGDKAEYWFDQCDQLMRENSILYSKCAQLKREIENLKSLVGKF